MPRPASDDEKFIAELFAHYIRHLLGSQSRNVYITPQSVVLTTKSFAEKSATENNLQLKILTPRFYTQLVTYPSLSSFLKYTLLSPWKENHAATSRTPSKLLATISQLESSAAISEPLSRPVSSTYLTTLLWAVYDVLHFPSPLGGVYPNPGLPCTRGAHDPSIESHVERTDPHHFMDEFVRKQFGVRMQLQYVCVTLRLQIRAGIMRRLGGE